MIYLFSVARAAGMKGKALVQSEQLILRTGEKYHLQTKRESWYSGIPAMWLVSHFEN